MTNTDKFTQYICRFLYPLNIEVAGFGYSLGSRSDSAQLTYAVILFQPETGAGAGNQDPGVELQPPPGIFCPRQAEILALLVFSDNVFLHHFSAMFWSAIKIFCISILSSPARVCLPRQQNRWSLSSVRQLFQFYLNNGVKELDEHFIRCSNLQDHNPSSANLPRLPQSVLSQHRDRGQQ